MRPGRPEPQRPQPSAELGQAVEEVLQWLSASPEEAAAALGINTSTLNAMRQGIVPMRSLVIRFAQGIGRRCAEREGAPAWWSDIDAWLDRAGYLARRDGPAPPVVTTYGAAVPLPEPPPERHASRPAATGPSTPAQPANAAPPDPNEPLAREVYRPVYERVPWGETFVHVFWLLDGDGNKVFRRHLGAAVDYKAEAARLKQDLAALPRSQFERKYGRFRVT